VRCWLYAVSVEWLTAPNSLSPRAGCASPRARRCSHSSSASASTLAPRLRAWRYSEAQAYATYERAEKLIHTLALLQARARRTSELHRAAGAVPSVTAS
jgi:hypothetical protein